MKKNKFSARIADNGQYFMKYKADPQIRAAIEYSNNLDVDILEKAIHHTLNHYTILCCRFEERFFKTNWIFDDQCTTKILSLIKVSNKENFLKLKNNIILDPMNPFTGPQIKIVVLRQKNRDSLIIKINHMITDIGGLKQYITLLISSYNSILEGKKLEKEINTSDRSYNQILKNISLKNKINIIKKSFNTSYENTEPFSFWENLTKKERYAMELTINGKEFHQIKKFARVNNATINDVITAAFFLAAKKSSKPINRDLSIYIPIDMRQYLKKKKTPNLCNLTSGTVITIPHESDDLSKVSKIVSIQMKKNKSLKSVISSIYPITSIASLLPYYLVKKIYTNFLQDDMNLVTNFGIIDEENIKTKNATITNAVLYGQVNYEPTFWLSFSTFKENITFSYLIEGDENMKQKFELFLDTLKEILTL